VLRSQVLLDRHGVLTRGAVTAEGQAGGFSGIYPVLRSGEEAGRFRRGYFVEGLGAAQFAVAGAVDRLRGLAADMRSSTGTSGGGTEAVVLAATDPANPYGAALPWPERDSNSPEEPGRRGGHKPARKAGALVVLVGGACVMYVERGGRSLLTFTDDPDQLASASRALAASIQDGRVGRMHLERGDGEQIVTVSVGHALESAGFRPSPRGLQLRG
jgi:ATP-dependent Lhr-like helicase